MFHGWIIFFHTTHTYCRSFITAAHCFFDQTNALWRYQDPTSNPKIFVYGGLYNRCQPEGEKKNQCNIRFFISSFFPEKTTQKSRISRFLYHHNFSIPNEEQRFDMKHSSEFNVQKFLKRATCHLVSTKRQWHRHGLHGLVLLHKQFCEANLLPVQEKSGRRPRWVLGRDQEEAEDGAEESCPDGDGGTWRDTLAWDTWHFATKKDLTTSTYICFA